MAKHSESSFDEAKEIRILSEILESNHKIKTFFKENDRTPNHDGNFELVESDGEPKKQFIVQIKKVSSLSQCVSGKNKGKFVYSLDTSFLYYVKAKVTESPAIYFVVDVDFKRVFYIYLSDEKLMSMDFEGKEHISYAFSEDEIITDINAFYTELLKISDSRNYCFLFKSRSEIAELQEAADYINNLFNGDFKVIKDSCFPGLWRFGIGLSKTDQFEISRVNLEGKRVVLSRPPITNMFGFYPQYKGVNRTEIGEYQRVNYGSIFDLSGQGKPMDYVKQSVHKIIRQFCQNPPAKLLPDIVLEERTYKKAKMLSKLLSPVSDQLLVNDLITKLQCLLSYVDYLFYRSQSVSENEIKFKKMVLNLFKRNTNCLDFFNPLFMSCIEVELNEYYKNTKQLIFKSDRVFKLISTSNIYFLIDLLELQARGVKQIHSQWEDSCRILASDSIEEINKLYSDYFSKLPNAYYELYKTIFSKNNEYRFSCKVDYYLFIDNHQHDWHKFSARINNYIPTDDRIEIKSVLIDSDEFTELEKNQGVISKICTTRFSPANYNQQLLYDGVRCWLYQGICSKLGYKIEGINLGGGISETIFCSFE